MKAQDLRLGNLVMFRGKICKVTTLSGDIIRVSEPEVGIIEQAYAKSPIELTPEVLGWAGFVDPAGNGMGYRISLNSVDELCWYKQDNSLRYQTKLYGFSRDYDIHYLHQLQNLYFALTGEELTISLATVKMEEK